VNDDRTGADCTGQWTCAVRHGYVDRTLAPVLERMIADPRS